MASSFGVAFAKAQLAVGQRLPENGTAFVSVNDDDKANLVPIARDLVNLGFTLIATRGTAAYLRAYGLQKERAVVEFINDATAIKAGLEIAAHALLFVGCFTLLSHLLPERERIARM